ncbi:DUF2059 domain-containing protein [Sphingomonas sp.]|uniref:DUF2059 domain-containing protein n=1 Tax=Sphingomonas sp. TaxID=28214 RepID=UPI0031D1EB98
MRLLALAALGFAVPVAAQTTPQSAPALTATRDAGGRIETARALVGKLNLERTLDFQFSSLMPLVSSNIVTSIQGSATLPQPVKDRLATPEGRQQAMTIAGEEMMAAFRARYPTIVEAAAEEYRRNFSEDELKAIAAFYDSPSGKRMLELQPVLQQRLAEAGRTVGGEAGVAAFSKAMERILAMAPPAAPAKGK